MMFQLLQEYWRTANELVRVQKKMLELVLLYAHEQSYLVLVIVITEKMPH